MKTAVKMITAIAFLALAVGGSALDSENLLVPVMIIIPALMWIGLLAWANRGTIYSRKGGEHV